MIQRFFVIKIIYAIASANVANITARNAMSTFSIKSNYIGDCYILHTVLLGIIYNCYHLLSLCEAYMKNEKDVLLY